jgi:hypothetical protein
LKTPFFSLSWHGDDVLLAGRVFLSFAFSCLEKKITFFSVMPLVVSGTALPFFRGLMKATDAFSNLQHAVSIQGRAHDLHVFVQTPASSSYINIRHVQNMV